MYESSYDTELIWLMGYPFTGTGVTTKIVEYGTNKSMATNYGDHLEDYDSEEYVAQFESHSIDPVLYPDGPFWHNMDLERDSKTLLVKTNCGGTCMHEEGVNCTADEYIGELLGFPKWVETCRVGRSFKPDKKYETDATSSYRRLEGEITAIEAPEDEQVGSSRRLQLKTLQKRTKAKDGKRVRTAPYAANKISKIVLTMRNPFVVIASRFRHYGKQDELYLERFFNSKGLTMWCAETDAKHGALKAFGSLQSKTRITGGVPCWTELYRLVLWYKNACRIIERYDSHVVHFEDYTKAPKETVSELMNFIGLEFLEGKNIRFEQHSPLYKWFTEDQLIAMARFMDLLMKGNECTNGLFRRYFADGWVTDISHNNNWGG